MASRQPKKRAQYVPGYFPPRNGVTPVVKEGRNYTEKTLSYMTPAVRADRITADLVRLMEGHPFALVEVCAGMGGNTVSFLSNDKIGMVISYEIDPSRRVMLERNITAYKLGAKSIVMNSGFNYTPFDAIAGCAMYIDPPWLPSSVDPTVDPDYKSKYILSGIKIGDHTMEEYLGAYRGVVYGFMTQVPPGYTLNNVEGWDIKHTDIVDKTTKEAKSRIYYATCAASRPYLTSNQGGLKPYLASIGKPPFLVDWKDPEPEPERPPIAPGAGLPLPLSPRRARPEGNVTGEAPAYLRDKPGHAPPPGAPEVRAPPSPARPIPAKTPIVGGITMVNWAAYCKGLPVPTQKAGTSAWVRELQKYVYMLLQPAISDRDVLLKMVGPDAMGIWVSAFTHETANLLLNYEKLEFVGDSLVKYNFEKYLLNRFRSSDVHEMSEFTARYLSKEYLARFSTTMKLGEWVIIEEADVNVNILEDLFEAFFGALDQIADSIKPGLGAITAFNYMPLIFKDETFAPEMKYGTAKTRLVQYGSRLHLGSEAVDATTTRDGRRYTTTITLSDAFVRFLSSKGYNLSNPVGEGKGMSKKASENAGYENALAAFNRVGFTLERVMTESKVDEFKSFDPALVARVRAKAMSAGFTKLSFKKPRGTAINESVTIMLRGAGATSKIPTKLSVARGTTDEQAKELALQKYAGLP